jgi:glucose uptake protein GlcU
LTVFGSIQLAASTLIFLLAATSAKSWALSPGFAKLAVTLVLYSIGNLIMLRLVREFGMARAFSLSATIQLAAVNIMAMEVFGERLPLMQLTGAKTTRSIRCY